MVIFNVYLPIKFNFYNENNDRNKTPLDLQNANIEYRQEKLEYKKIDEHNSGFQIYDRIEFQETFKNLKNKWGKTFFRRQISNSILN